MPELSLPPPEILKSLPFFRFTKRGDRYWLSSDIGSHHHLSKENFQTYLDGKLDPSHPEFLALHQKGFIKNDSSTEMSVKTLRKRLGHLGRGPHLFQVEMTRDGKSLSPENRQHLIALLGKTTSPWIWLMAQFPQGGPLDSLKELVKNLLEEKEKIGKRVCLLLQHPLTGLAEKDLVFCLENDIFIQSSLDPTLQVLKPVHTLHEHYRERGLPLDHYGISLTLELGTKNLATALDLCKKLIGTGVQSLTLQPISPWLAQQRNEPELELPSFKKFYKELLLTFLADSSAPREETAALILAKLDSQEDLGNSLFRSPGGGGVGELAINCEGEIFPNYLALQLAEQEEDSFLLGQLGQTQYRDLVKHDVVKSLLLASHLETLPAWRDDALAPFLGIDPVQNFADHGDLFTPLPLSFHGSRLVAMAQVVLELLEENGNPHQEGLFKWRDACISHRQFLKAESGA